MAEAQNLISTAESHLRAGRLPDAEKALRQVLRTSPNHPDALSMLAMICQRTGRREDALRHARQAASASPNHAGRQMTLCALASQAGQRDEAMAAGRRAVRMQPDLAEAHANLGFALGRAGRADEAIDCLHRAIELKPDLIAARVSLLGLLLNAKRLDEAKPHLDAAVAAEPDHPEVLSAQCRWHLAHGDGPAAVGVAQRLVQAQPANPKHQYALGVSLQAAGRPDAAITALTAAVQAMPQWFEANFALANALRAVGRWDQAIEAYRRVLSLRPDHLESRMRLAGVLADRGDMAEAHRAFDEVLRVDPNNLDALGGKARSLELEGELEQAYDLLAPHVDRLATNAMAASAYATTCRRTGRLDEGTTLLESAIEQLDDGPRLRAASLTLATLYEKAERYDDAFDAARRAQSALLDRVPPHDESVIATAIAGTYTAEAIGSLPRSTSTSERPVFIVGMPRSGTSLVEQIIAAHPQAAGAGELPDISLVADALARRVGSPYPEAAAKATTEQLDTLAERYERVLSRVDPEALRITDKMPHNYRHLGLITQLFPNARIIHCTRHPMDTCISCYLSKLDHGMHPYVVDLEALGHAYLGYVEQMKHWRAVLPDSILDAPYEEIVRDVETWARRLIEFVGLPWDDACLRFYESRQLVRTLSYEQVKQPAYTSSIGRYERFGSKLDPLRAVLEPVLSGA
jgi:tetratricopeptide (TPR) repeat protein